MVLPDEKIPIAMSCVRRIVPDLDKKNKDAKEAAEQAINESNRNYKEEQNKRRLELRAAEKAEKLNDIVRHQEQRVVEAF